MMAGLDMIDAVRLASLSPACLRLSPSPSLSPSLILRLCLGGCNPTWRRLQPYVRVQVDLDLAAPPERSLLEEHEQQGGGGFGGGDIDGGDDIDGGGMGGMGGIGGFGGFSGFGGAAAAGGGGDDGTEPRSTHVSPRLWLCLPSYLPSYLPSCGTPPGLWKEAHSLRCGRELQ